MSKLHEVFLLKDVRVFFFNYKDNPIEALIIQCISKNMVFFYSKNKTTCQDNIKNIGFRNDNF